MVALAAANVAAGLLGGMPISAALIRTKCNIAEGANHRISAFINGITLFIIAIACF
jgi:carbonic anhydrase